MAAELGRGLALRLGVSFVLGLVSEDVGEARERQCLRLGGEQLGAFIADFRDTLLGEGIVLGAEDVAQLGEGEIVEVAQVERGDGWVDEVLEKTGCQGRSA